jgi:hypothetical protein
VVTVGRSKYFTQKDTKKYGVVKGFRLQPTEERLLSECFYMLGVEGENFNQKMQSFIVLAHEAIKKLVAQEEEIKRLRDRVDQLLKQRVEEIVEKEETTPKAKPKNKKP